MANDTLRQLLITPLQKREAVVQVIVIVLSFGHLDLWSMYLWDKEKNNIIIKYLKRNRIKGRSDNHTRESQKTNNRSGIVLFSHSIPIMYHTS